MIFLFFIVTWSGVTKVTLSMQLASSRKVDFLKTVNGKVMITKGTQMILLRCKSAI